MTHILTLQYAINAVISRFDVETRIEDTIRDVSGAIIKLDDISADILTLIGNSREGAAAKKRRQLERKLNGMKTDMEKLNLKLGCFPNQCLLSLKTPKTPKLKLLEAKDEVKSRDAKCFGRWTEVYYLVKFSSIVEKFSDI